MADDTKAGNTGVAGPLGDPPPPLVTPVHPELVPQSLLPGKVMPSPQEIADRRLRATMGPARVATPEEPEATTQPAPKTSFMPLPPGSPPGPPPGAGGPADPNYKPTPDPIPISTSKSPAPTPISQSKATVTPEQKK